MIRCVACRLRQSFGCRDALDVPPLVGHQGEGVDKRQQNGIVLDGEARQRPTACRRVCLSDRLDAGAFLGVGPESCRGKWAVAALPLETLIGSSHTIAEDEPASMHRSPYVAVEPLIWPPVA